MFATPAHTTISGETVYGLKLNTPIRLNVRLAVTPSGITPTLTYQDQFRMCRKRILAELTSNRQLFRHAPSLESLDAITPMWGFIVKGTEAALSPYTQIDVHIGAPQMPCEADVELKELIVSRSTIRPIFEAVYLKPEVIDFDWCEGEERDELEEVSDIPVDADSADSLELLDPASIRRSRLKEKADVRAAFQLAQEAREHAEDMATRFYGAYDLSETESTFSELADETDEENENDDRE